MTDLQILSMQRFWKIKNSMLQLRTRRFVYLPMATNCQWCFAIGYQVNKRKLTQKVLSVNNLLLTLGLKESTL